MEGEAEALLGGMMLVGGREAATAAAEEAKTQAGKLNQKRLADAMLSLLLASLKPT
jgi:hypothetical protein